MLGPSVDGSSSSGELKSKDREYFSIISSTENMYASREFLNCKWTVKNGEKMIVHNWEFGVCIHLVSELDNSYNHKTKREEGGGRIC